MDPRVFVLLIPIVAILSGAAVKIAKVMAQARMPRTDPDTQARLADLEDAVGSLRRELEEAHERLDFTERLLAQPRPERPNPPLA